MFFFDYFDIVFRRGESEWPFSMLTGPLGVRIALKSETRIGDPKYITVDAGNGILFILIVVVLITPPVKLE